MSISSMMMDFSPGFPVLDMPWISVWKTAVSGFGGVLGEVGVVLRKDRMRESNQVSIVCELCS